MNFVEGLDGTAREALMAACRVRRYPKGSLLFAEGDIAHEVLLITCGAVKVVTTATSGREVVLDVFEQGALLGELCAIDGGERSAMAVALNAVEVQAVAQSTFRQLVRDHNAMSVALLELLSERLRGATRRQLEFGANDALGRVCHRLLDLADRYGERDDDGNTAVRMPLSQQDLAAWAGLSREAVVKGLRSLRNLGWIETAGRDLVLRDLASITHRADL